MKAQSLILAAALFVSGAVTPYVLTGAKSQAIEEEAEKTIISRESFTESYTIGTNKYNNMNYVVTIYDDNSVEIKAQHLIDRKTTTTDGETYIFGEIWTPDSYQLENDNNDIWNIEKYEKNKCGYVISKSSKWPSIFHGGDVFKITLTPTVLITEQVTLDIFGHEVTVPAEPSAYDPYNDTIDRLDADMNGVIDASDATIILQIYSANATGADIHNLGELNDLQKES
ncbi:MAG: hypothetical protein IKH75_00145 [Ruminococcus sp.]|nr:hypothetical protein [Ruminococcus sp.]